VNFPNPKKIARVAALKKQAGEVVHVKDTSAENAKSNFWAWNGAEGKRTISDNFLFNPKELKPLTLSLRAALMALGHVTSAHARFVKVKSRNVSPDGSLGGLGYVQKISDMRRQLMNCIEALSAFTDTIYDEINAPHWDKSEDTMSTRDRQEVKRLVQEAQIIKDDPEQWAEENELQAVPMGKTASADTIVKLATQIIASSQNFDNIDPNSYTQAVEALSIAHDIMKRNR